MEAAPEGTGEPPLKRIRADPEATVAKDQSILKDKVPQQANLDAGSSVAPDGADNWKKKLNDVCSSILKRPLQQDDVTYCISDSPPFTSTVKVKLMTWSEQFSGQPHMEKVEAEHSAAKAAYDKVKSILKKYSKPAPSSKGKATATAESHGTSKSSGDSGATSAQNKAEAATSGTIGDDNRKIIDAFFALKDSPQKNEKKQAQASTFGAAAKGVAVTSNHKSELYEYLIREKKIDSSQIKYSTEEVASTPGTFKSTLNVPKLKKKWEGQPKPSKIAAEQDVASSALVDLKTNNLGTGKWSHWLKPAESVEPASTEVE
eukprot:gnl/MRDRNA2_/MRDRNA2_68575_c0_seq2.p1 gnl/MRDRNA2_/MRDRNA2_68575_c0~~gnl/MRDRNA2_/MRDRNA2_68575_c0_seq2.p1  ORF type:complete len:317 (+),score=80.87 gnl/MRDRNA2_/MRDRNA2_68575_c0_seq2:50-1000(+)